MQNIIVNSSKSSVKQYLVVIALVISPFTLLRFTFFGLCELIFMCLFIVQFFSPNNRDFFREAVFTKAWMLFIFFSIIGAFINFTFFSNFIGDIAGLIFDGSSYLFILLVCFSLERMLYFREISIYPILKWTFFVSSTTMGILYIISLFVPSIFWISLRYHGYFVPLAKNLHQVSMFLAPLPFIGILIISEEKKMLVRFMAFLCAVLNSYLAMQTGSTKATIAIIAGFFAFILLSIYRRDKNRLVYVVIFVLILIAIVNADILLKLAHDFFVEKDEYGARAYLYSEAITVGFKSFIFGLGPGPHIYKLGKYWDAHQTFLTAFLQGGIIGVVIMFYIFGHIIKKTIKIPSIFAAVTTIFIYALGGDILRRLPIWIFLVLLYQYKR
jgi:hypothetical protein